jgi:hypothetical protein
VKPHSRVMKGDDRSRLIVEDWTVYSILQKGKEVIGEMLGAF